MSPLGQDDGLNVFPVQAAALGGVKGQLWRGVVVLWEETDLQSIYFPTMFYHKVPQVLITRTQSTKASTKLVAYFLFNFNHLLLSSYLWQLPFGPGTISTVVIWPALLVNML